MYEYVTCLLSYSGLLFKVFLLIVYILDVEVRVLSGKISVGPRGPPGRE